MWPNCLQTSQTWNRDYRYKSLRYNITQHVKTPSWPYTFTARAGYWNGTNSFIDLINNFKCIFSEKTPTGTIGWGYLVCTLRFGDQISNENKNKCIELYLALWDLNKLVNMVKKGNIKNGIQSVLFT